MTFEYEPCVRGSGRKGLLQVKNLQSSNCVPEADQ